MSFFLSFNRDKTSVYGTVQRTVYGFILKEHILRIALNQVTLKAEVSVRGI